MVSEFSPDDATDARIKDAIRAAFREGKVPQTEFLRRCEAAGMRALERRALVRRMREAIPRVEPKLLLPLYVAELAHSTGLTEEQTSFALGLPPEGLASLHIPSELTKEVVELLDLDREYVRLSLTLSGVRLLQPNFDVATAASQAPGASRDFDSAKTELRQQIAELRKSPTCAARVHDCEEAVARLFHDPLPGANAEIAP